VGTTISCPLASTGGAFVVDGGVATEYQAQHALSSMARGCGIWSQPDFISVASGSFDLKERRFFTTSK
jgi:hypothetical protein